MTNTPEHPHPSDPSSTPVSGLSHTDWSMIYDAQGEGERSAQEGMERLVERYWPAVYAFIRKTGRDQHAAQDLTQGFVCDVLLGRRLVSDADPSRGRFRGLLLHSLKNYLREQHRYETRLRRAPEGVKPISLDPTELARIEGETAGTPDDAFSSQWSRTLIRNVLDRVREESEHDGLEAHWVIFEHRVVRPMLLGEEPTGYAELLVQLDLEDASQAANMMITAKRRFARALKEEVSRTVRDPWDVGSELKSLLRDLEVSR